MEEINLPKIKIESKADNHTVFAIEPFFPGYGTTVGNAMRRVLLSSLPGAAVIAVRINGADHEFAPIPGVVEDAVQVLLNLKKLRFALHETGPVSIKLKADKAGVISGADLALPSSVELVNPELTIATLADKGSLEMEIYVGRGRGYISSEAMDDKHFPLGTIMVDASFSPVRQVAFQVEPTRVGEAVNYESLILDVMTDGTIAPDEALKQSAQILINQLTIFGATPAEMEAAIERDDEVAVSPRDFNIDEVNLSVRTTNALLNNGIKKVSDLLALEPDQLKELKGLGAKALDEIVSKLEDLGLSLSNDNTATE
jgi:DNA-directed RNA polymerase subunit alpha